jgi:hypothetical protein
MLEEQESPHGAEPATEHEAPQGGDAREADISILQRSAEEEEGAVPGVSQPVPLADAKREGEERARTLTLGHALRLRLEWGGWYSGQRWRWLQWWGSVERGCSRAWHRWGNIAVFHRPTLVCDMELARLAIGVLLDF